MARSRWHRWRVEYEELGPRAYLDLRLENTGSLTGRRRIIMERWPLRWYRVLVGAGTLVVGSREGWPGTWLGTVIGRERAVEVETWRTVPDLASTLR